MTPVGCGPMGMVTGTVMMGVSSPRSRPPLPRKRGLGFVAEPAFFFWGHSWATELRTRTFRRKPYELPTPLVILSRP